MRRTLFYISICKPGCLWLAIWIVTNLAIASPEHPQQKSQTSPEPLAAISTSDDVMKVSWNDISQALYRHPKLAVADSQIDEAKSAVNAAKAFPNPSWEATVSQGSAPDANLSRFEWSASLNLPLGWISQHRTKIKSAESNVDAEVEKKNALRREVLLELKILFWNLVYDQVQTASLENLKKQTEDLTRTVELRVQKGEARPIEKTRVEIEREKVMNDLEITRTQLTARQKQIALWLIVPKGKSIFADANLSDLPNMVNLEKSLPEIIATHPKILAAQAHIRSLDAEVKSEKMAWLSSITLSPFTSYELDRRAYGIGIGLDLPVWNWNSARVAQAQAKLAESQKLAEAVVFDLQSTLIETHASCQSAIQTATRLKVNVLPRSQEALDTVEKIYTLGEANLLEVIDVRRTSVESHQLFMSALVQAQINCSRLSIIIEEENP